MSLFCIIVREHILFLFVFISHIVLGYLSVLGYFRFLALKLVTEMLDNHFIILDLLVYLSYLT